MRLAKEGLLEPHEAFQMKHTNTYFTGTKKLYSSGGVSDDHIPFLQKSKSLSFILSLIFFTAIYYESTECTVKLVSHLAVHIPVFYQNSFVH